MGSTNSSTKVDDYLIKAADNTHTCRICYEEFDDKDKVARLLSCGHSFCTKCLTNLVKFAQQAYPSCPECRKVTRQNVMTLPINFQFMQILRKMNLTVDPPETDDALSTTATLGQDGAEAPPEQPVGELESLNDPEGDQSISSLLEQMHRLTRKLKDKASHEVYQHQVSMDDPYHWADCLDKIEELEESLSSFERSYESAMEHREYYDHDDDDDDDDDYIDDDDAYIDEDDYEDHSEVTFNFTSDHSDVWGEGNPEFIEPSWDFRIVAGPPIPGPIVDFSSYNSTENWSSGLARLPETPHLQPSQNQLGQSVLKCVVCDCLMPYGCENSHLTGRRHSINLVRRECNRPIVRRIAPPGTRRFHGNRGF